MPKKIAKSSKKILLVEDDAFLHKVLSQRLKEEGFDVTVAMDGETAVANARDLHPDIVLLDLILPKKSGFEVLTEIRALPGGGKIPVVVLSNLGQQEDIDQVKKLGVKDYLVKADHSLSEMVAKVKEHIAAL